MDPYELLGLNRDASTADVRKAFRKLCKKYHPDIGGDPEKFKELNLAADVLSDPARRKRYDETGRTDVSRITPQRVQQFLAGTFEGVIAANDDIATVDVQRKLIRSIQNGMRQAHSERENTERKIERAHGLMRRFVNEDSQNSVIHTIMKAKLDVLLGDLQNVKDAIELAETAIALLEQYEYAVDPAPEGPMSAGPTLNPRYGGRSSSTTVSF